MPYRNELIVSAQRDKNLSDVQLAKETGLSRPTVMKIRRGSLKVWVGNIEKVAEHLGVPMSALYADGAGAASTSPP
jgi:transcriptional regulator with XRE-family HTH domain